MNSVILFAKLIWNADECDGWVMDNRNPSLTSNYVIKCFQGVHQASEMMLMIHEINCNLKTFQLIYVLQVAT